MNLKTMMENIVAALPETSKAGWATVREVCLTFNQDRGWEVMAGGHHSVHIGEWGGDFNAEGKTAEEALTACLKSIKSIKR